MAVKLIIFAAFLMPCVVIAEHHEENIIGTVLDDFHDAAANADEERYLNHMAEYAVFMGTDEWERWPKNPDFAAYVKRRFKSGAGWNYRSVERKISVSPAGDVAWFDEVVFSEINGRFRGTGVLVKVDGVWKIGHYALSFLVLNENWQDVVELTKETKRTKKQN